MHHRARLLLAGLVAILAVAGCSGSEGDGDGAASSTTASEGSAGATSTTLDEGPFCQSVRALDDLGDDADDGEAPTPEAVVAQSEEMLGILGEITVNVPEDSPPAVEELLDDLKGIAEAVTGAGGDVDAAYAALQAQDPDLWARLGDPDAHQDAFEYFADRCGTSLP